MKFIDLSDKFNQFITPDSFLEYSPFIKKIILEDVIDRIREQIVNETQFWINLRFDKSPSAILGCTMQQFNTD